MELRGVPEPSPGPGEVRIRVAAAGLNPVDYKLRQGKLRVISGPRLPIIAGCEVAGTVDVGPGTSGFEIGERVYARVDKSTLGAFAELVCVQQGLVAAMPVSLGFMHPSADDLRFLATLVDEGALQPVIDNVYPFASIADAFAALERGHAKGKIVVTLPAAPR